MQKQQPIKNLTVMPQSESRVSLVYRNTYCLNVDMHENGLVSIRDGAFSAFETSKLIEDFNPVQGLKVTSSDGDVPNYIMD